jgi:hypothetical protein
MDLASTNLVVTLIIGGVVGWLASILMKTNAQWGCGPTRRLRPGLSPFSGRRC